jgi:hypothetical protein
MSSISPELQALALRVTERALPSRDSQEDLARELGGMFTSLRQVLSNMVGEVGYQALLLRAHRLTRGEFPWLPEVGVSGIGFPGSAWEPHVASAGHQAAVEAATALLRQVLVLIASLLGEDFTFRIVRRAWPDDDQATTRGPAGEN